MKMNLTRHLLILAGALALSPASEAQTVGRVRKSLDKATGGATSGSQPAAPAPAVNPQAAANAQAQAAANQALYNKKNKAAQAGVDQRVIDFLKQRIEDGSADAAYDLAKRYDEGKGVEADPKEARKLYKLAAERGNEDAKKWLAENPAPPEPEPAEGEAPVAKAAEDPKAAAKITKPDDKSPPAKPIPAKPKQ